jgi:Protein of unknown function (DUF2971)
MRAELRPVPQDPFRFEPQLRALERRWLDQRDALRRNAPRILFHCTGSVVGLLGMAESGRVWATDVRFLNDRAEIRHGLALLSSLLEAGPSPRTDIGEAMYRFIADRIRSIFHVDQPEVHVFAVCLCKESDLANQWFMYADRGRGFELGFDLGPNRRIVTRDAGMMQTPVAIEPVTYDQDVQVAQLSEVLEQSLRVLNELRMLDLRGDADCLARRVGSVAGGELAQRIAVMKHRSFRNEHEWRFTYLQRDGDPENALILYRGARGEVPYVPLDLRGEAAPAADRLPLRQVLIGPHAPHQHEGIEIAQALEAHGYASPEVTVRDSECPLYVADR